MASRPSPISLDDAADIAPGTVLAELSDLPDHGGLSLTFQSFRLLIQKIDGMVFVFENKCPHAGTPLDLFEHRFLALDKKHLLCRTHGALFDPETGKCVRGPCKGDYLRTVEFEIVDGKIIAG